MIVRSVSRRGKSYPRGGGQVEFQIEVVGWDMASGQISDAELRDRLQKLGECPGPITETTRNIYLHKLRTLTGSGAGERASLQPTRVGRRPKTPPSPDSRSPPPTATSSYNDDSPPHSSPAPDTTVTVSTRTAAPSSVSGGNHPLSVSQPRSPQLIAGNIGV